jgi:MFS family permease
MVAASAITATLTTLLMGTLSDRARWRFGRRKPFILIGYILWGISTILFPTVAYIKTTSLAVIIVVIADSIMTFFGSTANDAAFNAWTTDIASTRERGRVEGVLNMAVFIAQIVAMAAAGVLIDQVGYFTFFTFWVQLSSFPASWEADCCRMYLLPPSLPVAPFGGVCGIIPVEKLFGKIQPFSWCC